jgi:hypothetical protein
MTDDQKAGAAGIDGACRVALTPTWSCGTAALVQDGAVQEAAADGRFIWQLVGVLET